MMGVFSVSDFWVLAASFNNFEIKKKGGGLCLSPALVFQKVAILFEADTNVLIA